MRGKFLVLGHRTLRNNGDWAEEQITDENEQRLFVFSESSVFTDRRNTVRQADTLVYRHVTYHYIRLDNDYLWVAVTDVPEPTATSVMQLRHLYVSEGKPVDRQPIFSVVRHD